MSRTFSYKHHIIPRHEWRRRFGNLKGFNSSDNTVLLSLEQHIQAHQLLFELFGCEYDRVAYLAMSGQVTHEEASRIAGTVSNIGSTRLKGIPKTPEHREAIKESWKLRSRQFSSETKQRMSVAAIGNKNALGYKFTKEQQERVSLSRLGKKRGKYKPRNL